MIVASMIEALCLIRSPNTLPKLMCDTLLISALRSVFCEVLNTALVAITESSVELLSTQPIFKELTAFSNAWFEKFGELLTSDKNPLFSVILSC